MPPLGDRAAQFGEGIELVQPFFVADISHGHDFDVGEVAAFFSAPGEQAIDFFWHDVHFIERDAVDFHGESCFERGIDSLGDGIEGAAAC